MTQSNLDDYKATTGFVSANTFNGIRHANLSRLKRWHVAGTESWTGADWSNAMCGEAGEVADAVKKMRRIETGFSSNNPRQPKSVEEARQAIKKEIGDVIAYLDLLAAHYQIDLADAVADTFNAVSEREGFPERIRVLREE